MSASILFSPHAAAGKGRKGAAIGIHQVRSSMVLHDLRLFPLMRTCEASLDLLLGDVHLDVPADYRRLSTGCSAATGLGSSRRRYQQPRDGRQPVAKSSQAPLEVPYAQTPQRCKRRIVRGPALLPCSVVSWSHVRFSRVGLSLSSPPFGLVICSTARRKGCRFYIEIVHCV